MRRTGRKFAALLAAGLALVTSAAFGIGSAAADTQPRITIAEGQTITKDYAPLGSPDPSGSFTDPDGCSGAPGHVCDVIPLTILDPPKAEDFVISVALHWDASYVANGAEATDDCDLYVWDDPQGKEYAAHSAGTSTTERAALVNPKARKYQLVVYHSAGVNKGYTLTLSYLPGGSARPDESLDPSASPGGSGGSGGGGSTTVTTGRTSSGSSGSLGSSAIAPSVVATPGASGAERAGSAIVGADPNFLPAAAADDLGSTLTGPRPVLGHNAAAIRPPRPVSVLTVMLSLVALPLALGITGAAVVLRRRGGRIALTRT